MDPHLQTRNGQEHDAYGAVGGPLPIFDPAWRRFRLGVRITELLAGALAETTNVFDDRLWYAAESARRGDGPAAARYLTSMRRAWPHGAPGKLLALGAQCALGYGAAAEGDWHAARQAHDWPSLALESLGWEHEEASGAVRRTRHESLRDRGEPVGFFRGLPLHGDHGGGPTLALLGAEVTLEVLPLPDGERWVPGWRDPDGSVKWPGDFMPSDPGRAADYIELNGIWRRAENGARLWLDPSGAPRAMFGYQEWPPRASAYNAPFVADPSEEEALALHALAASLRVVAARPAP